MAKGSTNGVIRGKKGNTVFYNIKNSNNKEKQGWREYKAEVANPQTDGQIDQRVKMAAVNNLYRALKPIIQRGWENKKYGDESRRAFLKRALGASFTGPYIEKGSTIAAPIEGVPITYGSLPQVMCICEGGGTLPIFPSLIVPDGVSTSTIGNISQIFISSGMAQEGDQVTIIFGWVGDYSANVQYKTFDFIVDVTNATTAVNAIGVSFDVQTIEDQSRLYLDEIVGLDYSGYEYCCLCSVSRNGDGVNLRSYAEFTMTPSFRALFYDNTEQNAAAKRSYRKNLSADTNWPLVPDSDVVLPVGTTRAMLNSATPAQVQVNAYRMQGGYLQVWDNTNSIWRYVYGTGAQNLAYHKWLTSTKTGENVWSSTAPSGAQTADAIMFTTSNDATEADQEFARWLVSDAGYDPLSILR